MSSTKKSGHKLSSVACVAATALSFIGMFLTVPQTLAADIKDDGPWGTYKNNDPNIITIFYDHIGRDAKAPQGDDIESSKKWFINEIEKYSPNVFSSLPESTKECRSNYNVKKNPNYHYTAMIFFPPNSKYKTIEDQRDAGNKEIEKFKEKGFPGFYGEFSRSTIKANYNQSYKQFMDNTYKESKMNNHSFTVGCISTPDPRYGIDKGTKVVPTKDSVIESGTSPMNATIFLRLSPNGSYLNKYDEKLNGTVTLTYETENTSTPIKTPSKNVSFKKNDKTVKTPDFIPEDFGLTQWVPGVLKYEFQIPNQGILNGSYKNNPDISITTVEKKKVIAPNSPIREGNKLTVLKQDGVNYFTAGEAINFGDSNQVAMDLVPNEKMIVTATPDEKHVFEGDQSKEWKFSRIEAADVKQSDILKPKQVDTKQSDKVESANVKQSDTPKPAAKPIDIQRSDIPKPAPTKPVKGDGGQSKRTITPNKHAATKQSRIVDVKQSANVKKQKLPETGANDVSLLSGLVVLSILVGAAGLVIRRRL